ncbi:cytochrome p450 monooxygenase [Exophiala viscosa]|uniref:Cytochrome p450 monooxygenase n=1 Tax=Exophiala viscosa TaxID=2486360 RepID=A0AAN6IDW4_9EURO|nr:cytochrome p450 monooxygenase [Exophiala viscosa]
MDPSTLRLGVFLLLTSAFLAWKLRRVGRRPSGMPPGPPTLPILGNLHQMPTKRPHLQFQKWAEEYGPVYSLMLGTKPTIILSSDVAIKDLLDKRGGIYSDRPDMFISQRVASGGHRLVVMRYGETWRLIHKLVHNILNINVAEKYVPYQDLENKFLLQGLLDHPDDLFNQIRRFSYSVSTQLIFGFRCPSFDDPMLERLFYTVEEWGRVSASGLAQVADLYPIIQKLPSFLAPGAVKDAEHVHKVGRELYTGHWLNAKQKLEDGTGLPCICNDLLLAQQSEQLSDEAVGYIVGSLLEGGSDTTSSTLYGFIQAMMVWPEVQKRAQEEIERVVGSNRLPVIDDYQNLPYIRCCVKETLRWMPTVIMGVPHAVVKDDSYNGWFIPKGATVINNVWTIHMDPNRSPEPRRFNPDRYADDQTTLYQSANGEPMKRDNFNFGAGRRLCQGIHIAERSLFLGMSRILWGFNLNTPLDDNGNPVTPDVDNLVGGITVHPAPFQIKIEPRSPKRAQIIRGAVEDCKDLLDAGSGQWKKVPDGMVFGSWKPDAQTMK